MAVGKEFFDSLEQDLESQREADRDDELYKIIKDLPYEQNFDNIDDAVDYAQEKLESDDNWEIKYSSIEHAVRDYVLNSPNKLGGPQSPDSPTGAL